MTREHGLPELVDKYYIRPETGHAVIEFSDVPKVSILVMVPPADMSKKALEAVLLYQKNRLEAVVAKEGDEPVFWTRGNVQQDDLADYWGSAIKVGACIQSKRNEGKMPDSVWNEMGFHKLCDISQKSWLEFIKLQKRKLKNAAEKPCSYAEKFDLI